MTQDIEQLQQADRLLAAVATPRDALDVMDLGDVALMLAKKLKLGTSAINHAQRIKLQAECKLADVVDEGQAKGEIAKPGQPRSIVRDPDNTSTPVEDIVPRQRLREARKVRDNYGEAQVEAIIEQATTEGREVTRAEFVQNKAHVAHNTGQNEWYTPPVFVDVARAVMGTIDTDPASSAKAQTTIQAGTYYTAESNGLTKIWQGNVWMNPPYAQPLIGQFIDKLATYRGGQWCALVNNATDTQWGQQLLAAADYVCFVAGRVRFLDPDGNPGGAPLQGQMLAYRGPNGRLFADRAAALGTVLRVEN